MFKKVLVSMMLLVTVVCFTGCAGSKLRDFSPSNEDEKLIFNLIVLYEDAWNSHDKDMVLSFYHEDAKIIAGKEKTTYSKEKYAEVLPDRFVEVPNVVFDMPTIKINGDKATAMLDAAIKSGKEFPMTFTLVKENYKWLISEYSY